MLYTILFFDEALQDVKEAKKWYKKSNPGVEKKLAIAVKEAITKLQKNPELNAIRYKNIRFSHTHTFPYVIHYYIDADLIVIIAIVHKSRHPDVANKRL